MQLAMPSVFKEDASAPNWRMVLDEIKSVKERLDELTLGQRRIQEKLGTEVSQPLMSTETMARQSSKTSEILRTAEGPERPQGGCEGRAQRVYHLHVGHVLEKPHPNMLTKDC